MKEIISYLDNVGHALGIGDFEGLIGALVIMLAALVIVVHSFSLLRRTGSTTYQDDGQRVSPLEWMEDAEKSVGADQRSKGLDPSWVCCQTIYGINGRKYYIVSFASTVTQSGI